MALVRAATKKICERPGGEQITAAEVLEAFKEVRDRWILFEAKRLVLDHVRGCH